jgi:hypothetical protein
VEAEARQPEAGHVVEAGRRLSESMLWRLQRDLYDAQGIHAWSRGNVPQSITTSPYIARAYAQIAVGYLRDVAADVDRSQPVYIVELGGVRSLRLPLRQTPGQTAGALITSRCELHICDD